MWVEMVSDSLSRRWRDFWSGCVVGDGDGSFGRLRSFCCEWRLGEEVVVGATVILCTKSGVTIIEERLRH